MKVGIVAPPWVPIPPKAYGGTELAIDVLSRGLLAAGHEVVLFTTGDSTTTVPTHYLLEEAEGMKMGTTTIELRHVIAAYEALSDVDIIHDHTVLGPLVLAPTVDIPVVTTNHGPFQDDTMGLWQSVADRDVPIISISHNQASTADATIPIGRVIHHGLDPAHFPYSASSDGYVACLGRMAPEKGIHLACELAHQAGVPLRIGAKMREPDEYDYFETMVRPLLCGDVEYLGELGTAEKLDLLRYADSLLNPISWAEPFGLVMIEAMACGTPVISTPHGAVPEIVTQGQTGFVANDRSSLLAAIEAAPGLDRAACRARVETTFSMTTMVQNHVDFYQDVIDKARASTTVGGSHKTIPASIWLRRSEADHAAQAGPAETAYFQASYPQTS